MDLDIHFGNSQKYKILVIDDNANNIKVIFNLLEQNNFDVVVARDGEFGLKRANQHVPNLILLDVMMPEVDGFEVCRLLKSGPQTKDIPIIFMTSLSDVQDKVKGFEAGAVDYITKPIQHAEVIARINTHLQLQRLTHKLKAKTDYLEISNHIGQKITAILDINQVMEAVVDLIQQKFNYYCTSIWLSVPAENCVRLQAINQQFKAQLSESLLQIPLDNLQSIIAWVTQTGQPYLTEDTKNATKYLPISHLPDTRSELALPLLVAEKPIGVLDIQSKKLAAFDLDSRKILTALANQVAIAINNAHLYKLKEERTTFLSELNAAKDKFFSIVAHDLRAPFQPVLSYSQKLPTLVHKKAWADVLDISHKINQGAESVFHLLENLLQWATLQRDKVAFNPINLSLKVTLDQAITWLEALIEAKQITLHNLVPETLSVVMDKNMLLAVFRNLLSNALKFTPVNGDVTISIDAFNQPPDAFNQPPTPINTPATSSTFATLSIADSGVGIPSPILETLFNQNTSQSTPGTVGEQGSGLGLFLCQEIIEQHGGKIWAVSTPGKGTTFKFTVPVATNTGPISVIDSPTSSLETAQKEPILNKTPTPTLIAPPPETLNQLLDMALKGDLNQIKDYAEHLKNLDKKYIPFTTKLTNLAQNFEDRAILNLIETHIK